MVRLGLLIYPGFGLLCNDSVISLYDWGLLFIFPGIGCYMCQYLVGLLSSVLAMLGSRTTLNRVAWVELRSPCFPLFPCKVVNHLVLLRVCSGWSSDCAVFF